MKKITFATFIAVLFSLNAMAQAVLPTSWSFTTPTLPVGWTESGTGLYTASGNTPPTMKLDNTGDYLIINFASAPGNLTYFLAGNSFAGGTFTVEESDLGSVWTTLHTFTAPTSTYTQFTDVPQATSRYIRFIYTTKVSGNVGLDDVNIAAAPAGPQQEINVKQGATTIVSGGSYTWSSPVSTMTPATFTIENLGTVNTLNISSAVISGANAADFTVSSSPSSVTANGTAPLTVDFTPAIAGTRNAVLTISSDDADEASYVVNLIGIGGSYATEPAAQATSLNFTNVKTYRFNAAFTSSASAEEYIVLRKTGSAVTGVPADGTVYQRGDLIGDGQVVYSGPGTSFTPNYIAANTTYHFAVYAYNGDGTYRNYLTTSPLTGSTTTPATMMPAGLYAGINTSSATFVADLHAVVNPHQQQFYSNYGNYMVKGFYARDTTLDRRVITCVYSGENKIYSEPFDFTATGFSREHTYCYSWMPVYLDANSDDLPEYSDYHHLFPTNQNQANAVRSNYPLGEVVTVSSTYLDGTYGLDANGNLVYEPREEHKGDAARAMMYEAICYTTVAGNNWGLPNPISPSINYGQDQGLLKQWHYQDLPDSREISRNDYVDSLQGNRNPFVDSIDFVCFVNFTNMSYEALGCVADIEEALNAGFIAYPNPAKNELSLHVNATTISSYEILDMQGRVVLKANVSNLNLVKLNIAALKSGSYIVKAVTPYGVAQKSLIIE
ncbi:MAG: endonuclease [Fluviicola sp.]|nr:endonuclease [Fluviicola sp.]